jgi:hypothetical protein
VYLLIAQPAEKGRPNSSVPTSDVDHEAKHKAERSLRRWLCSAISVRMRTGDAIHLTTRHKPKGRKTIVTVCVADLTDAGVASRMGAAFEGRHSKGRRMTRNSNGFGAFLLRTWFVNRRRWNCAVVYLLVFCQDLRALPARWSRHNRNGAVHADSRYEAVGDNACCLHDFIWPARAVFRIPRWCGLSLMTIDRD